MTNSPALLQLRERIQRFLTDEFGSVSIDGDGVFNVRADSTAVFVSSREWGPEGTLVIRVYAPVLFNFEVTPEVLEYLARENDYVFGTLTLLSGENDADPIIEFQHTLLGNYLDPQELVNAVLMIGSTADKLDDELVPRFGGKRLADLRAS